MGADAATIKTNQHASGRRPNWELGLKRPQPWDVFVEVARELRQNYVDDAIGTLREAIEKQPNNSWMHFVWRQRDYSRTWRRRSLASGRRN